MLQHRLKRWLCMAAPGRYFYQSEFHCHKKTANCLVLIIYGQNYSTFMYKYKYWINQIQIQDPISSSSCWLVQWITDQPSSWRKSSFLFETKRMNKMVSEGWLFCLCALQMAGIFKDLFNSSTKPDCKSMNYQQWRVIVKYWKR